MKYIFRLLCLPFFAAMTALAFFREWLRFQYNFVRFGGEAIPYKRDSRTIEDVYSLVKEYVIAEERIPTRPPSEEEERDYWRSRSRL